MATDHDAYGKDVFRRAVGNDFNETALETIIDFDGAGHAHIDGTVGKTIAVEFEARVSNKLEELFLI